MNAVLVKPDGGEALLGRRRNVSRTKPSRIAIPSSYARRGFDCLWAHYPWRDLSTAVRKLTKARDMMHLAKPPRADMMALCGQLIDGWKHQRTMPGSQVDCPKCMALFRACIGGHRAGRRALGIP